MNNEKIDGHENQYWFDRPSPGPMWLHRVLRLCCGPFVACAAIPLTWWGNEVRGEVDKPPLWLVLCAGLLVFASYVEACEFVSARRHP
ncbi:hypothetical protein [Phytomonospora endophytica]|uniref:Uncharacterized protein n=1 Tax=Phytomonospora endophytica TaxID=714109 RepID=A0A841FYZ9_9ACTN|nr:hypothetical protein [Phytomonospora endophytica]MBB6038577.1 hypothetical protein [Phytomonospora endophytica]GIG69280.1 hypothetical protein Pen01_55750 [Phytomonospora endophytica]